MRAAKHHPEHPHHSSSVEPRAAEEWITIATPALVEPALFAAVQEQLAENRRRKRQRYRGASALLQGLLVCGSCGYAFSARTTRYHTRWGHAQARTCYRCLGSDAHRYAGVRLGLASPPAAPAVEAAVWAEVCALLEDPRRVEAEYARRCSVVQAATPPAADQANTAHLSNLRQGLARLIDSYTEGFISKDEFEPRITRLRQRIAQFEDALRGERDEVSALRDMHLLLGRMEEFAVHVRTGLADANWQLRRDILRALVKRIDVTDEHVTVVFRVAARPLGPARPNPSWQHWLPRLLGDHAQAGPRAAGRPRDGLRPPVGLLHPAFA